MRTILAATLGVLAGCGSHETSAPHDAAPVVVRATPPDAAKVAPDAAPPPLHDVDPATLPAWAPDAVKPSIVVDAADVDAAHLRAVIAQGEGGFVARSPDVRVTGRVAATTPAKALTALASAAPGLDVHMLAAAPAKPKGPTLSFDAIAIDPRDLCAEAGQRVGEDVVVPPGDLPLLDAVVEKVDAAAFFDAVGAAIGRPIDHHARGAGAPPTLPVHVADDELRTGIAAVEPRIEACVTGADSGGDTKLDVAFEVDASGKVTSAHATGAGDAGCVELAVASATFPASESGAKGTVTVVGSGEQVYVTTVPAGAEPLPPRLHDVLATARLAATVSGGMRAVAVFELSDGSWYDVDVGHEQMVMEPDGGAVWSIHLEPGRVVYRLPGDDQDHVLPLRSAAR